MKIIQSTYQPFLTLDYIVNESENKLFDRKSAMVKATDLSPLIAPVPCYPLPQHVYFEYQIKPRYI